MVAGEVGVSRLLIRLENRVRYPTHSHPNDEDLTLGAPVTQRTRNGWRTQITVFMGRFN